MSIGSLRIPGVELLAPESLIWVSPYSQVFECAEGITIVPQPPFDRERLLAVQERIPRGRLGRPRRVIDDAVAPRLVVAGGWRPLRHRIGGDLGWLPVAVLAGELVPLLAMLHREGLAHGALSPDSVVLDTFEDPGLIETGFGYSIQACDLPEARPYLSPERLRGQPPSAASDAYALGAILFEAVAGRPPFGMSDNAEKRSDVPKVNDAVPFADFPESFERLVFDLLSEDPKRRPDLGDIAGRVSTMIANSRAGRAGRTRQISGVFSRPPSGSTPPPPVLPRSGVPLPPIGVQPSMPVIPKSSSPGTPRTHMAWTKWALVVLMMVGAVVLGWLLTR